MHANTHDIYISFIYRMDTIVEIEKKHIYEILCFQILRKNVIDFVFPDFLASLARQRIFM